MLQHDLLIEAYEKARLINCSEQFILLLEEELIARSLIETTNVNQNGLNFKSQ